MATTGVVALKMRYLGGTYVGQDLCWCKIEVGENAVAVHTYRAGVVRRWRFIDDPAEVSVLKSKLRTALARMRDKGRWQWTKIRPGNVYITIYYPSRSWLAGTGQCRLFAPSASF